MRPVTSRQRSSATPTPEQRICCEPGDTRVRLAAPADGDVEAITRRRSISNRACSRKSIVPRRGRTAAVNEREIVLYSFHAAGHRLVAGLRERQRVLATRTMPDVSLSRRPTSEGRVAEPFHVPGVAARAAFISVPPGAREVEMDDYARRLVDREKIVVFEKNVEGWVSGRRVEGLREQSCWFRDVHRQHVAGRDSRRDPANGLAVDADGSSIDPRLHPGAGCRLRSARCRRSTRSNRCPVSPRSLRIVRSPSAGVYRIRVSP